VSIARLRRSSHAGRRRGRPDRRGPAPQHDCGPTRLPVYLDATFEIACTELLGTPCAFAFCRTAETPSPVATAKQLAQLATLLDRPVVLVEPSIPSWRRKRLAERRVAFVAPSTQLYLPPLGIDLRDALRIDHHAPLTDDRGPFAPSTQVVLLDLLLVGQDRGQEPEAIARRLGYSLMSISRAGRALERANLIQRPKHGRQRYLRLLGDPKDVWERAQPWLVSPVRARYAAPEQAFADAVDAGETALANQSMLAPPPVRSVAVSSTAWASYGARHATPMHEPGLDDPRSVAVEVWTYPPESLSQGPAVDPLSLYLSLRDHDDARVERARESLTAALA
jgi:DNA-binding MarR family transcriptional regulator